MEIQQLPLFASFIERLGWKVFRVDGSFVYIRNIPLMGTLAKLQRAELLPNPKKFLIFLKQHNVAKLAVEPATTVSQQTFTQWLTRIQQKVKISTSAFLPTKTLYIDLKPTESIIFGRFDSAKRRAVRRAQKHGVSIQTSVDIDLLVGIKNKSAGAFGFVTTYGIKILWQLFTSDKAEILIAYAPNGTPVGGVLLILVNHVAYYWIAGATKGGKKLFAPTLLVWEALRVAKKRKCRTFDFVGVWDERTPQQYSAWKGFTKFKEGFGGKPVYYPIVR